MALIELLTVGIGAAVAKTALRRWLEDSDYANSASTTIVDIIARKLNDVTAQRRGARSLERVAEDVAEALVVFFEVEARELSEREQEAAALAVADAMNSAQINEKLLFASDLDPQSLAIAVRQSAPDAARDLNEAGRLFYDRALREACTYVIEITSTLPTFALQSGQEMLRREGEIERLVKKVLDELPKITRGEDAQNADIAFLNEYRRALSRKLDQLELFGISTSVAKRRYSLSVAYITLTAARPIAPGKAHEEQADPTDDPTEEIDYCRVDEALARCQRVLIRGEAGSGKTTMLQWLAVQAARESFEGALDSWNGQVPFFIQLRRWVDRDLPKPESFLDFVTPNISDEMPRQWVHRQLRSGALVLIDGIDEVPETKRHDVKDWIDGIAGDFPESRVVVTSRPAAVEEGWLSAEEFEDSELQPMDLADVQTLIDQWHEAARMIMSDEEVMLLSDYRDSLKSSIRKNRPLRNLATTPLLCAMLCTLHLDRRKNIPRDRMEFYRLAMEILERREVERGTMHSKVATLTTRQKDFLLQRLAYWLLINDRSDADREEVETCLGKSLHRLPTVDFSASELLQFLLERSGLLREAIPGRIDFIHRSFQEYLAARAVIDEHLVDLLINNAHLDQWREVIILSAGHATQKDCDKLIGGLLDRARRDGFNYKQIPLLPIACLETATGLSPRLRFAVEDSLRSIVPPRSLGQAKTLAAAGEIAIPYLTGHKRAKASYAAACVRALGLIGGDAAYDALGEYCMDTRSVVISELVRAQGNFDRTLKIVAKWKTKLILRSVPIDHLSPIAELKSLRSLDLRNCRWLTDLAALKGLKNLDSLRIERCEQLTDLTPLAYLSELQALDLTLCSSLTDISPLSRLRNLRNLTLWFPVHLEDLSPLAGLAKMQSLQLSGVHGLSDISPLRGLFNLSSLELNGCEMLSDLTPLSELVNLQTLELSDCGGISDLAPVAGLKKLRSLNLSSSELVENLAPLTGIPDLRSLDLSFRENLTDLSTISGLTRLYSLSLAGCEKVNDLKPLSNLTNLMSLDLWRCEQISDLAPLARMCDLQSLDLGWCKKISDLRPLANLPKLFSLNLRGCDRISDLSVLGGLSDLEFIHGMSKNLAETLPADHPARRN